MILASMSADTKPNRRQTTGERGTLKQGCRTTAKETNTDFDI